MTAQPALCFRGAREIAAADTSPKPILRPSAVAAASAYADHRNAQLLPASGAAEVECNEDGALSVAMRQARHNATEKCHRQAEHAHQTTYFEASTSAFPASRTAAGTSSITIQAKCRSHQSNLTAIEMQIGRDEQHQEVGGVAIESTSPNLIPALKLNAFRIS